MSGRLLTPAFRQLCASTFLSQSGFWVATTVLQWHVAEITGGDPLAASRLYLCQLAPLLIVPPIAGAMLDRLDRRALVVWPSGAAVAIGLLLTVLSRVSEDPPGVLACQLIAASFGTMIAIATPTFQSMAPTVVPVERLESAVALAAATLNVSRLAGPAIAAVALSLGAGLEEAGLTLATLYGLSVLLMRTVPRHSPERSTKTGYLEDLAAGFHEVLTRPDLRRTIALVAATACFGLAYLSILPAVAIRVLDTDESGYSLLLMVAAAGALLGALGGRLRPRNLRQASYALAPMAIGAVVITRSTYLPLSILACLLLSVFGTALMIGLTVLVQRDTRDEMRGRVTSVFIWAWGGALPLGGFLYGALSDRWSLATAGETMAVIILVTALLNLVPRRPRTAAF